MSGGVEELRHRALGFGRTAGLLLAAGLIIAAWSLYFRGDWRNVDVDFYHLYALQFWNHLVHPILPNEYPPLSVLPFALTLLGPVAWFPMTFAAAMALVGVASYVVARRLVSARQAGAYAIYALAAGIATLFFRYDLLPAFVTAAAIWCIYRNHFSAAYCLVSIATLLKLFAIVVLPAVAIAHWSTQTPRSARWQRPVAGAAACLALVGLGFGAAAAIDPTHALGSLTYDVQRPDEVEAVPSTVLWLLSFGGLKTSPGAGFGSLNLLSSASAVVNGLADAALVGGLVFVYWRQVRGRYSPGQAALASVLVLLCTSKVLSSQYFIWIAPLLALTVEFQLRWLFLFLTTAVIFPTLWEVSITPTNVTSYSWLFLSAIGARNALLVVLTFQFLRNPGSDIVPRAQIAPPAGRAVTTTA